MRDMKGSNILLTLLFVWLFAIFAPSVIMLCNNDGNTVLTTNLNEEEQQEQGKKNVDEKLILEKNTPDYSRLSHLRQLGSYHYYELGHYNLPSEILLPPPEHIV